MVNLAQVFGHNVRHHRITVGLKQGSLAQLVGISTSMMSAIEKGATLPSMEVAVKLAGYFTVPLSVLVDDMPKSGEEEPDPMPADAVQIRVLQLFRDLAVAPAETRDLIADWIRELGSKLHSHGGDMPLDDLLGTESLPSARSRQDDGG